MKITAIRVAAVPMILGMSRISVHCIDDWSPQEESNPRTLDTNQQSCH
jgi:hypothetical protein